jgi:hypothetical protein
MSVLYSASSSADEWPIILAMGQRKDLLASAASAPNRDGTDMEQDETG